MFTPSGNKSKAKTPAKTPGWFGSLFGVSGKAKNEEVDGDNQNESTEVDFSNAKGTKNENTNAARSLYTNSGPDFLSGTPARSRSTALPQQNDLQLNGSRSGAKTIGLTSPWGPQRGRDSKRPASSMSDGFNIPGIVSKPFPNHLADSNKNSKRAIDSQNAGQALVQNNNDENPDQTSKISIIENRRRAFKPRRAFWNRRRGHNSDRNTTHKKAADSLRALLNNTSSNQFLLAETAAKNRSSSGYQQFCGRGRLLSQRTRILPQATDAATVVVFVGEKRNLDSEEEAPRPKKQKVSFQPESISNREALLSPVTNSSSVGSSPSRASSSRTLEELPAKIPFDLDGPIELGDGTDLNDFVDEEADTVAGQAMPIPKASAYGKLKSFSTKPLILDQSKQNKPKTEEPKTQSEKSFQKEGDEVKRSPKRPRETLDKEGSWKCKCCDFLNTDDMASTCSHCKEPRTSKADVTSWGGLFDRQNEWKCEACFTYNPNEETKKCRSCETLRPENDSGRKTSDSTKKESTTVGIGTRGFSFQTSSSASPAPIATGSVTSSGFSFGASSSSKKPGTPASVATGFSFGSSASKKSDGDNKTSSEKQYFGTQSTALASSSGSPFTFGTSSSTTVESAKVSSVRDNESMKSPNKTNGLSFGSVGSAAPTSTSFAFSSAPVSAAPGAEGKSKDNSGVSSGDGRGSLFGASEESISTAPFLFLSTKDANADESSKQLSSQKPSDTETGKDFITPFGGSASVSSSTPMTAHVPFAFGSSASSTKVPTAASTSGFSFGISSATPAPAEREETQSKKKRSVSGASDAVESDSNTNKSTPSSTPFQFGVSAPSSSTESSSALALLGTASSTPANTSSGFTFGSTPAPSFPSTSIAKTTPSTSNFAFGGSTSKPSDNNYGADTSGKSFGSTEPVASGIAASGPPAFGSNSGQFGASSSASSGFGSSGTNSAPFGADSAKLAPPPSSFGGSGEGAAAPAPFAFGSSSSSAPPAQPAFQFGANSSSTPAPGSASEIQQGISLGQTTVSNTTAPFGQSSTSSGGFTFGASQPPAPATSFGQPPAATSTSSAIPPTSFGAPPAALSAPFGMSAASGMSGFGQPPTAPTTGGFGGGGFGSAPTGPPAPSFSSGGFGSANAAGFGGQPSGGFGSSAPAPPSTGGFGAAPNSVGLSSQPVEGFQMGMSSSKPKRRIVRAKRPAGRQA